MSNYLFAICRLSCFETNRAFIAISDHLSISSFCIFMNLNKALLAMSNYLFAICRLSCFEMNRALLVTSNYLSESELMISTALFFQVKAFLFFL